MKWAYVTIELFEPYNRSLAHEAYQFISCGCLFLLPLALQPFVGFWLLNQVAMSPRTDHILIIWSDSAQFRRMLFKFKILKVFLVKGYQESEKFTLTKCYCTVYVSKATARQ
jgi:hypothetical protein